MGLERVNYTQTLTLTLTLPSGGREVVVERSLVQVTHIKQYEKTTRK